MRLMAFQAVKLPHLFAGFGHCIQLPPPSFTPRVGRRQQTFRQQRIDPRPALDGGADGLDFYRFLAEHAPSWMAPLGRVMLEFGDGQESALPDIFQRQGWRVEAIEPDYARKPRLFIAGRSE